MDGSDILETGGMINSIETQSCKGKPYLALDDLTNPSSIGMWRFSQLLHVDHFDLITAM